MTSEAQTMAANTTFWEQTYTRNFDKLCARANRKLTRGRMAEAEDIVSDTFMKVMLAKDNASQIKHPLQYLWIAIKHAWVSQQGRREVVKTVRLEDMTMKTLEKLPGVKLEPKVLQTLESQDALHAMRCKLGPTSLKEKTMAEMRLEGYSFSEIAEELGEDLKTTRLRWRNMILRQRTRGWSNRRKTSNVKSDLTTIEKKGAHTEK
jgi:DNA-directed RNA polymerase specialized sigma24 family protein